MESITVRELNQNTSAILARVVGGESLEVTIGGRPAALLLPVNAGRPGGMELSKLAQRRRVVLATDPTPIPLPSGEDDEKNTTTAALTNLRNERI